MPTPQPRLDDPGCPCLALLTTNVEQDLERACASGGHSASPVFNLVVGNRALRIALLRGPVDEIVELIEVQRSRA
jgi:hypothetical protein